MENFLKLPTLSRLLFLLFEDMLCSSAEIFEAHDFPLEIYYSNWERYLLVASADACVVYENVFFWVDKGCLILHSLHAHSVFQKKNFFHVPNQKV